MLRVVVALVAAGCFSKPGLSQRDAGTGDDGSIDGAGDGGQCDPPTGGLTRTSNAFDQVIVGVPTGPSITFADPTKYPFPVAINIGAEQLVPNAGGCGREDQVGVAVFPVYSIAGNQNPTLPNHPLDLEVDGPAYKQLRTNWTYEHDEECQVGDGVINGSGNTAWGFYPDGRVVRYDYLSPATAGTHRPTNACSCLQNTMTWTITSFFSFESAMISSLTAVHSGGADPEGTTPIPGRESTTSPPDLNPDVQDAVGACFTTPGGARTAVRWDVSSEGRRDTRIRAFPPQITFVHDLVPGGGAGADDMMSSADTFGLRTHMFLQPSGATATCTQLNTALARHAASPSARVDGTMIAVDGLGFYDDTIMNRTHTTAATFTAAFGPIDDGWALRIKFPGFRSITTSVPSRWQHESDDTFYIFFPDALDNNASVTITPQCTNP
jgi:hypothetical protein